MISSFNMNDILKNVYLDTMAELLNTRINPLLSAIEQTTGDVWGKEIRRCVTYQDEQLQYVSTLKNLYTKIEIPAEVMCGCLSGRMIDLLNDSTESCLQVAKQDVAQMLYGGNSESHDLTSISAIFDISKPLYGLDRNTSPVLMPVTEEVNEINDAVIEQMIDELSKNGSDVNFIAISADAKSAYMQYAEKRNKHLDVVELKGGFRAITINGIPCVFDKYVPQGCMYFLDTSVFKLHQLCDWRWLELEDGKILRQTPDNPNTYTATLVKYCDLICDYPNHQGMIRIKKQQVDLSERIKDNVTTDNVFKMIEQAVRSSCDREGIAKHCPERIAEALVPEVRGICKEIAKNVAQEFCYEIEQCGFCYSNVMETLDRLGKKYGVDKDREAVELIHDITRRNLSEEVES